MENCEDVKHVGNLTWNSQPMRNKKNRENTHQRKTITRTRQYLHGLANCVHHGVIRILLLSGTNTSAVVQCFNLSKTTTIKTLITKTAFSTSCAQDSQWATKRAKNFLGGVALKPPKSLSMSTLAWAYQPKPSFHGLSLKKSLIKNHATLFKSSQVIN